MNTHPLLLALQAHSNFRSEDFEEFLKLFVPFTLRKNEFFYTAGSVPRYSPFIVSGCVRKFYIDDGGNEQIVFFAEEGAFAGELQCMRTNCPTEMYLQALEKCEILAISMDKINFGLENFPAYRQFVDVKYALDHNRFILEATRIKREGPEQAYRRLLKERPSLILRVPQIHIANYLGTTTETISRIRRKIAQR